MRIERHQVRESALDAALEGFADRIEGDVHRMGDDPMPEHGWGRVSDAFLDYVAARSVRGPELLGGKDCRLAFTSAATAAIGAMALDAGRGDRAHVHIAYTGSGFDYEDDARVGADRSASPRTWLRAFHLHCISGVQEEHLLIDAAPTLRGNEERADVVLVHALMACVFGRVEGRDPAEAARGTSSAERLAAIDSMCAALGAGTDLPDHRATLATLRALAAGDRPAFERALAAQLDLHRERHSAGPLPAPRTLLPLDAIALAALASWGAGWHDPVDSAYLPPALVRCFRAGAPRVRTYGRDKRADAVAALAAGPLTVDRPPRPLDAGRQAPAAPAAYDDHVRQLADRFRDPGPAPDQGADCLLELVTWQLRRFRARAAEDPQGGDARQREALLLAVEAGTAAVRLIRAEPGAELDVTFGGTTRRLTAGRTAALSPHTWQTLTSLALITGDRELLAGCVLTEPGIFGSGVTVTAAYGQALHDYLRGADPGPAVERALTAITPLRDTTFTVPPVVLLSQLVEGDREGFALALADALEEHREHYSVGTLTQDVEASLSLDVLALVCLVRRMGWSVPVVSPYLPEALVTSNSLVSGPLS